jgi:hypothetical protein
MAYATAPDIDTIATEGLKKAGYASPSSAKITRAQDEWMEEIKNDIYTVLKDGYQLLTSGIVIISEGQQQYSLPYSSQQSYNPLDIASIKSAKLLYGSQTGTAQAGAATTITLAAASTFTEDWVKGKHIVTTGGTGPAQERMCSAYNTSTKVATVPTWAVNPDNTTTYMIVDTEYPLEIKDVGMFDKETYPMNKNRPSAIYPLGDSDYGEFICHENPDQTYGIRFRYFADLQQIDLASDLMTTLYRKWRNVWIEGVKAKALEDDDDDRAQAAMANYKALVNGLVMREKYGMELSEMAVSVDMG